MITRHFNRLLAAGAALCAGAAFAAPPAQPVAEVDLARYAGKWYETAKLPMPLERDCASNATVEYVKKEAARLAVHHRCETRSGAISSASGTAVPLEGSGNAKLRVSFPEWAETEYWIIGLGPAYRWAVVGTPDRQYLWILSRTPALAPEDREQAIRKAREQGFKLDELRDVPQR